MVRENEWTEIFGTNIQLIVSKEHCFNTDTILLADFSMPKNSERTADLGTGCGTIPFFWRSRGYQGKTIAVEIQKNACEMLKRSIETNKFNDCIKVINTDLKNHNEISQNETLDLISCNPPYKRNDDGIQSIKSSRAIARHELECTISDVIRTAQKLLRFAGRLCLCHRTERLCDVLFEMRSAGIEPKKIRFVQQRQGKNPKLFLVEGKKGSKPGIVTLPTLIIESEEMEQIYSVYRKEN